MFTPISRRFGLSWPICRPIPMPIQIHLLPLFPGILFPGSCVCLCAIFKMPVGNRSHSLKSSGAIFFVGPSPLLVLTMGIAALLLLFAGTTQPVQAVPVPMPFRRFFFLSAANPTMLGAPSESQPIAPSAAHQSLADAEVERLMEGGEGISVQQHNQKPSQHSSRAALRGRVPMGPFDQWKRGGDFCGCNMGCFYHSVGQCASCCSLGL